MTDVAPAMRREWWFTQLTLFLSVWMLAVIQAVVGQFYMAVIVAVFVGMYATQRRE